MACRRLECASLSPDPHTIYPTIRTRCPDCSSTYKIFGAAVDREHRRKRRRAAIRHAIFTRGAVRLTGGRVARPRPGKDFDVNGRVVTLPKLPDALCGMTITHLSDPHVGELITPDHLPHIVESANELGGDLIAVTGDFVDFSNAYLPAVVDAMSKLEAPLGAWFVLGNHDYLDDGAEVCRAFKSAGLNLLMNEGHRLAFRDHAIALGGIDWADKPADLQRLVQHTCRAMPQQADLRILLAHHPHAFDAAQELGIGLTLSGHTHGGQLILSNNHGKKGSIGLGNLAFRYTRGLYARGDSRLFVSSGVGSWFPVRIQCPAEITLLELQAEL
ncbi:MAG: hypothetical protein GC159_13860 [Phycisphaera sp.]|nr:hypothetical protein [Phycisphaera sp.]